MHRIVSVAAIALALPCIATAQNYPSKPIRIFIPQTPGSGVDLIVRRAGEAIGSRIGQPMLVENHPAANSVVAADLCAHAVPDGHTLCVLNNDGLAINPNLFTKLPYDAARDFQPITNLYYILGGLYTRLSFPANSAGELKSMAAAKPSSITWGTLGPNTITDMSRMWLGEQWNTTFLGIPYKGGPQIFTALTAAEIDITWQGVYGAIGLMKAGKLKLLAVGGSKRIALYPDVPTLKELGVGNLPSAQAWWGVLTQAGVPDPVVRRLNAEYVRTFREPRFVEYLDSQLTEPSVGTPEEFGALIRRSREQLGQLINKYNIPKQ